MKVKILSLLLSVTILFFAAVPARAAEGSNTFNVLDYCLPDGNNGLISYLSASDHDISFSNPMSFIGSYVDILCYIYGNIPTQVSFVSSGGDVLSLTLTLLSNNLYRIQGSINGYEVRNFNLRFNVSGNATIEFLSFNISPFRYFYYDETGTVKLETYAYSPTINYNPSDTINGRTWTGVDNYTDNFVTAKATLNDWKLYDSWDAVFFLAVSDINTITVTQGSDVIPADISVIHGTSWVVNDFYISVVVDLTACNKRSEDIPTIHIEAAAAPGESNTFTVMSMAGGLIYNTVDPVTYWLQRIHIKLDGIADPIVAKLENVRNSINRQLDNVITAIRGDSQPGDSFQNDVQQEIDELDQAVDVMDSVSRPDINSIDVSMNQFVSGADLAVLTAPVGVFF